VGAELRGQRVGQTDLAAAVLGLRRLDSAADQRAADADLGLGAFKLDMEPLQGDRLADP
jgi:hypothetical protein